MKPMLGPCSQCGEEIEFDDYMLGREAECPFCHGVTICDGKVVGGFPTKIVAISAVSLLVVTGAAGAIFMKKGGGGDSDATLVAQASGDSLPPNPFSSSASSGDGGSGGSSPAGAPAGGDGMSMGMDMGMSMDMNANMAGSMAMDAAAAAGGGSSGYDAIKGFLIERCGNCHGAEKQRGDYRLDTLQGALTAVSPGQATRSALYSRISLPRDSDDIMPPKGAPLTPAQIAAVKAWIDSGAK